MKKIFLSLFILFVGFISFSDAISYEGTRIMIGHDQSYIDGDIISPGYCIRPSNANLKVYENGTTISFTTNITIYCFNSTGYIYNPTSETTYSYYYYDFNNYCTNYTSEQCQTEYNLIPIENVDSEYCELNNLCEVIGGSGSSTLYINDIWHESAPFIYVNIPEEIQRDYNTGVNEFTINVQGLNGDQDYINGIIDVNSYRPTSEDFTQTFVGGLTLIFPYIIITAVILFIWRFIRKIFK